MALPDPLATLTVDAVDYVFNRVSFGDTQSVYRTSDGLNSLTISRQEKSRNRYQIRFDRKKVAANPFDSSIDQEYTWTAYMVVDVPPVGVTAAEAEDLVQLLTTFLVAGTPDYILRALQGEI
jgi:hypothetical protein